jgi:hypothetical protein
LALHGQLQERGHQPASPAPSPPRAPLAHATAPLWRPEPAAGDAAAEAAARAAALQQAELASRAARVQLQLSEAAARHRAQAAAARKPPLASATRLPLAEGMEPSPPVGLSWPRAQLPPQATPARAVGSDAWLSEARQLAASVLPPSRRGAAPAQLPPPAAASEPTEKLSSLLRFAEEAGWGQ